MLLKKNTPSDLTESTISIREFPEVRFKVGATGDCRGVKIIAFVLAVLISRELITLHLCKSHRAMLTLF